MKTEHIKLYTSSLIIIERLKAILIEEKIESLIKNHQESARLAGFGTLDNSVELYVLASDYEKAQEITNNFEKQLNK